MKQTLSQVSQDIGVAEADDAQAQSAEVGRSARIVGHPSGVLTSIDLNDEARLDT